MPEMLQQLARPNLISAIFCALSLLVAAPSSADTRYGHDALAPGASPKALQPSGQVPAAADVFNPLPAPSNLMYTNDPVVCKAHIPGLGAALVCPGLMASAATLPLVWDWKACSGAKCVTVPDGYRIYQVTKFFSNSMIIHFGGPHLVDTQPDPSVTIRGISPFQKTNCYVVRAFKGDQESPDSNEWCGAADLAMGSATLRIYPTQMETRVGVIPTQCSPHQTISVQPGIMEEGVVLASRNKMGGHTECWATVVSHGYAGFKINARGRIWKALLTVPSFDHTCNLRGVVQTPDKSWFETRLTGLGQDRIPQAQTSFINTDAATERTFDVSSDDVPNHAPSHTGVADITSWFPQGGLTSLGIGFTRTKYYDPADSSQPSDDAKKFAEATHYCANPWLWTYCIYYLAGGQFNSTAKGNPPDTLTPCAYEFPWVWLDIQYYPNS
jgi:hypothetical protein